MVPTSGLTSACTSLVRRAQLCENALGFAYGCAMGLISELVSPSWRLSFETFRKVSKLFRKLLN